MFSVRKFSQVPSVTGKLICPSGIAEVPGITPWNGELLQFSLERGIFVSSRVLVKRMLSLLPLSISTLLSLMLQVWEHRTVWLLVFIPVRTILIARLVLGVFLHVFLQGKAILCRVLSFGVERARRLHYLPEVIHAGSPGRPTALGCRDHVITLALEVFRFGGLR